MNGLQQTEHTDIVIGIVAMHISAQHIDWAECVRRNATEGWNVVLPVTDPENDRFLRLRHQHLNEQHLAFAFELAGRLAIRHKPA